MSEPTASYFSKLSDRHPQTMEDVMAQNRLLGAATDTLIARIEKAEALLKAERIQSDTFQAQVRMLVQRELELLRMLAAKNGSVS